MLRKFGTLAALSLMAMAQPAFSDGANPDHVILVTGSAYFPQTTYATSGETVRFVNQADGPRTVIGAEEAWTSGEIPIDGIFDMVVAGGSELVFSNGDEDAFEGTISFDPAPVD